MEKIPDVLWMVTESGEDCWHGEDDKPLRFSTEEKAQNELKVHKEMCEERGMTFDPDSFQILPVKKEDGVDWDIE